MRAVPAWTSSCSSVMVAGGAEVDASADMLQVRKRAGGRTKTRSGQSTSTYDQDPLVLGQARILRGTRKMTDARENKMCR